jgi:hypothetical protein
MIEFDFGREDLSLKLQTIRRKAVRLSTFRLGVFFGMAAVLILGVAEHPIWLIPGVLLIWLFVSLIKKFNAAKNQEAIYLAIEEMECRKRLRQSRELASLQDGLEFSDKAHPFSGDLDLFGSHSLFQLLNHTTTSGGKDKLAQLMKSAFSPQLAQKRAQAVNELKGKPEFLRALESVGIAFGSEKRTFQSWKTWLGEPQEINFLHHSLAIFGPLGGLALLCMLSLGMVPQAVLGIWILLGVLALSLVFTPLKRAAENIPLSTQLKSMAIRVGNIESEKFQSELLLLEKSSLYAGADAASVQLKDLDRLGLWVQNRLNLLYLPINLLFWTDFLIYLNLAKWKKRVAVSLQQLPETLENWEVWVSLGSFELEVGHPGISVWTEEKVLEAINAAHPLIYPGKAIGNSISLGKDQPIVLLTGANMSGKTTFMRTLGINAVLVNLGLKPFADRFVLGPIQLFTSMRNSDNLGESVSSFYAELHRIRTLIQRLEAGEPIFFLLDEILKGTNTQDRISGSEALIYQILQTPGFGIISTHDIELSEMGKSGEKVLNYSFHSEIQDETIHFDYKLKNGPCPSFNAHKLMELMGIRFERK